jgi:hypothetical protein
MSRKTLCALGVLLLGGIALVDSGRAEDAPIDTSTLGPIMAHRWVDGTCEAPLAATDFVVDQDGHFYQRQIGSYTPLSAATLAGKEFTATDTVGPGSTVSVYRLQDDGTLRLWSQVFTETADGPSTTTVMVKDGATVVEAGGDPQSKVEMTSMIPCAPQANVFPEAISTLFNGVWADTKTGSCEKGEGLVFFDVLRPVPRLSRGGMSEIAQEGLFLTSITPVEGGYEVIEGGLFDATVWTYAPGADGTMVQTPVGETAGQTLKKCPG